MSDLEFDTFDTTFKSLTGNPPFPWQSALYERFANNDIPASCNLPTGLGKTSVIAIWLIALAKHPDKMPRRLVYVVNRRTVVDQTTDEVEKYRKCLHDAPRLMDSLRAIGTDNVVVPYRPEPLAISTLRGQFADNREWSADPSRPAVICGTVDMIGSRLLFSGYGTGFKSKPLHAGFLGQDVLVIHDEAHLEPAFQSLLLSIQDEQKRCNEFGKFRVMELTATSRGKDNTFPNIEESKDNEADPIVQKRINSSKAIKLVSNSDSNKLAEELSALALKFEPNGNAILLFAGTVVDVHKIRDKLPKGRVITLTGTMRGKERDALVEHPIFKRFLSNPSSGETVYLVCTSAGEVGINISANHLVCDLSTFESMAQRFGRVNRFGNDTDTQIHIVYPSTFGKDGKVNELELRRMRTLELIRKLDGNGSPAALGELDPVARVAAFSPQPTILPVTDILFDAWALTTIRDKLPGRPPVAEYLHGVSEWEPPQTKVAWRAEVSELKREFENERERKTFQKLAGEMLEDYPLKNHELLSDRTDRVFNAIKKLAAAPETPVWILDDEDRVEVTTLGEVCEGDKDDLNHKTILLPPQAGGLENGLLDGSSKYDEKRKDYDVADECYSKDGDRLRLRKWDDDSIPAEMKRVRKVEIGVTGDEEEPTKTWYWFVRPAFADADAKAGREYDLQTHLDDAKAAAQSFVAKLKFDETLSSAIVLAAMYHDLGKDRLRWQRGIGNTKYPDVKLAKSGNSRGVTERSSYRHEFGSLLDVTKCADFNKLELDEQELVLHLIAAHHGRGRPHFPTEECFDDNPDHDKALSLANEVPRRFAKLQRKYGRWGLAYLESLVRASDILASKKAEGSDV